MSDIQFNDNKILFVNNKIAFGADCCCVTPGEPCVVCPDTTPLQLRLVASGLTICADCTEISSFDSTKWTTTPSVSPNGTFILTQTGNACVWLHNSDASGTVKIWDTTDCTGDVKQTFNIDGILWQVGSGFDVLGCYDLGGGCRATNFVAVAAGDPCEWGTVGNTLSCGTETTRTLIGFEGGSVTVTAI